MGKNKVLIVGWDAADWKVIHPLMDNGYMPALNKLVNQGVMGHLRTLEPALSPMLWTSIATGKTADRHGVLGFLETNESTGKVQPVSNYSRKTRAIWNILNANGYRSNVFNWWPSHPSEPLNGIMVSNFFNRTSVLASEEWKVNEAGVHPKDWLKEFTELRVHGEEIGPEVIHSFIPSLYEILDQLRDKDKLLIGKIRKYLAETVSVHAQATLAMEKGNWDFTAIYYEAIDQICHLFMQYVAPKMNKVSEEDFERYKYVVNATYVFHDMMLERLIQLAGEDTTVILLSDHGFHSGDLRPRSLPKHHASIALQHNPQGIFVMKGKGIRKDHNVIGVGLLDIVPTLLTHLDLPVGQDMDGKVIQDCFDQPKEVNYLTSWDQEAGDFGEHDRTSTADIQNKDLMLQELVDLGYIELDEDEDTQRDKTNFDKMYHLSVVHSSRGRLEDAIDILEDLYEKDKVDVRVNIDLIDMYLRVGKTKEARTVLELFRKINIEKLVDFEMLEVRMLNAEKQRKKALPILEKLYKEGKNRIAVRLEMGSIYRSFNRVEEALKMYKEVIALDAQNYKALHGLGICQIRLGQFEAAAQSCLDAIAIQFDAPSGHFHLGEALMGLELFEEAANAFETSLALNPKVNRSRKKLVELYRNHISDVEKAELHERYFKEQESNEIIIVSGLPRSGTSMMMQMLQAGGISLYTDGVRKEDESNPNGYYELEAVKSIQKNSRWLRNACGKAIKVVAPLLTSLKLQYNYKVIFMEREMNEILLSQQKMKRRLKVVNENQPIHFNVELAERYEEELQKVQEWEKQQPNVEVLRISYADLIAGKPGILEQIDEFLDQPLGLNAMKAIVDPSLYRERLSVK